MLAQATGYDYFMKPIYHELPYQAAENIFPYLADTVGAVWLDSALSNTPWSRYSYIGLQPTCFITAKDNQITIGNTIQQGNPFTILQQFLANIKQISHPDLPPFQGGVIGYWGYELAHHIETLPVMHDDKQFPDLVLGVYDVVLAFDHLKQQCWLISSGLPADNLEQQQQQAATRLRLLSQPLVPLFEIPPPIPQTHFTPVTNNAITSNFANAGCYEQAVQQTIDYIYAGDIFQANISQRFQAELPQFTDKFAIYQQLRAINPAPFAAYLNFGDVCLAAASPERFILVNQNYIETCPIKGTCKRGTTPEEDAALATALMQSEKNNAENTMIVDLLRNDLSKIAQPHSVQVKELCKLYSFATVHHLISTVTASLAPSYNAIDVLQATFPGGSITGAPKIRAMEIIAELEPTARGPYCGCFGYIGFNGNMDTAITIRTLCMKGNSISFQVGGGIVADSMPTDEYNETLIKGQALMKTLTAAKL
jgi:para-aminobenzoate synthetase component 1